jgi:hypothetical protein
VEEIAWDRSWKPGALVIHFFPGLASLVTALAIKPEAVLRLVGAYALGCATAGALTAW